MATMQFTPIQLFVLNQKSHFVNSLRLRLPKITIFIYKVQVIILLYIEGVARDKSEIKNITINDKNASFDSGKLNPNFSATIETAAIDVITIKITDIYDNQSINIYNVQRSTAIQAEANPMGKTWVVFIENSNYTNLSSLEAVASDVALVMMLSGYIIDSIVSRKNMNKAAMERFLYPTKKFNYSESSQLFTHMVFRTW